MSSQTFSTAQTSKLGKTKQPFLITEMDVLQALIIFSLEFSGKEKLHIWED